jgi:putative LysE/RhtB family amino acid efflux pump
MALANILTGALIGAVMSIPFGPIGAICLNRILRRGQSAGLASGFGVALGDSCFAAIVVLGITQLSNILLQFQYELEFGAGLAILIGGIRSYRDQSPRPLVEETPSLSQSTDDSGIFYGIGGCSAVLYAGDDY